MAHKVNPKGFRLGVTIGWDSRWFDSKNFSRNLAEDLRIRNFLRRKLSKVGLEKIEIERFPGKIKIIINTSRPGLIIGRQGRGIEIIKKELINKILGLKEEKKSKNIQIVIKEIKNPWLDSLFVAQWVARQIEARVAFRRALKQALGRIKLTNKAEGARIEVAGRLNGVTIARTEWLAFGRLPRQTLRANIDFSKAVAHCTYGAIGVKVWIYKGEKFESDKPN